MNKVVSYLGLGLYAESLPATNEIKLYTDNGGAQGNRIWLVSDQITALQKFLHDIEEDSCNSH